MGLREQAREVIAARDDLDQVLQWTCTCSSMTLQRDGCQCGKQAQVVQAWARLEDKLNALRDDTFEEEVSIVERYVIDDPSVLLKVAGRPFRCNCGANVFRRFTNGQYQCNACEQLYEGE